MADNVPRLLEMDERMSLDKDPVDDPYLQNYSNHEAAWRPKANYDVMRQVHHSGVSHFYSLIKQKSFQLCLATGQQIASRLHQTISRQPSTA